MPTPSVLFSNMASQFNPDNAEGLDAVAQFDLTGENGGYRYVTVADGKCEVDEGSADAPTATVTMDGDDYSDMVSGELNAVSAFMSGKVKVEGDLTAVMKLQGAFG